MKRNLAWIVCGLGLLVVVVAVRIDRVRGRAETPSLGERPVAVRTARIERGRARTTWTVSGVVEAAHGVDLAPEVTARVVERLVEPGDRVRAGQLLLRLDDAQLAAQLEGRRAEAAAAVAQVEGARHTHEAQKARTRRDRRLFEGGALSREALESSEAALARARAAARAAREAVRGASEAVEAAEERLAHTELRAPWNGEVAAVSSAPGDLAVAGRPTLRLVRDGAYRVDCRLPQEAATALEPGGPATLEAGGRRLEVVVSRVGGGLDPSGLAIVEIDVPRRPLGLSDGATVRVTLGLRSAEGLAVPVLALLEGAGGPVVYRLDRTAGDRVESVPVEVRLRGAELAVVEGDLRVGDRVVTEHPSILMLLSDGISVHPVEPSAPWRASGPEPNRIAPEGRRNGGGT